MATRPPAAADRDGLKGAGNGVGAAANVVHEGRVRPERMDGVVTEHALQSKSSTQGPL
jgi:hypothetical protein